VHCKLENYQIEMRDFLLANSRAGAFVSPGMGKTAATLSAIKSLIAEGFKGALVVAPLRVATYTWPNEISKWDDFKWLKFEVLRGQEPSGNSQIYITNYEQLPNLKNLNFCDLVVFDEITRAKNHKSQRIKAVEKLFKNHWRWGLTGTPRPNSLLELFAQIKLLDGGQRLGKSFTQFKQTYFYPTDYMGYNWEPKKDSEEKIYAKIKDLTITLRSSDYLDLPETFIEDIEIGLPIPARKLYTELERKLLVCLRQGEIVASNAAVLANKLLQITGGASYSEDRSVLEIHEGKIEALKRLLHKLGNTRVIIAANYIHERERICKAVQGCVASSTIKGNIEEIWNKGEIQYLVADPRSLGHGLNLQQGGSTVVWFSPTWSRELYDQFNARVARKGQKEITTIYRIICKDTIDEAVIETLRERGLGQSAMLNVLSNLKKAHGI